MNIEKVKDLEIKDEFELREKRLKLVYKILYVIAAIWIALIFNISKETMTNATMPLYVFLLSSSSIMIIKIIKYALIELRCMKITSPIDENFDKQAEEKYDNIWKTFSAILIILAVIMLAQMKVPYIFNKNVLMIAFSVCILREIVIVIIEPIVKKHKLNINKLEGMIRTLSDCVISYSICALLCMAVMGS